MAWVGWTALKAVVLSSSRSKRTLGAREDRSRECLNLALGVEVGGRARARVKRMVGLTAASQSDPRCLPCMALAAFPWDTKTGAADPRRLEMDR